MHWIIDQWKQWGVTAIIVGATNTITWVLARRKEWRAAQQAKTEKEIDARVLEALGNRDLWGFQRPMTGSGILYVRAAELAEHLRLDSETVSDSLERLEERGRVKRGDGNMSNPAPDWRIVPR